MGATAFTVYSLGIDADEAFRAATEDARHEYGHGGYTGTIAEKHSFIVITPTPIPLDEAEELANRLVDEGDPRIDDKWGPAGALPTLTSERTVTLPIPESPHGHNSLKEAAEAALEKAGERREGEMITFGIQGSYTTTARGRVASGIVHIPLRGGPLHHTSWLFFGWAST
jgi:hypothetical protein